MKKKKVHFCTKKIEKFELQTYSLQQLILESRRIILSYWNPKRHISVRSRGLIFLRKMNLRWKNYPFDLSKYFLPVV